MKHIQHISSSVRFQSEPRHLLSDWRFLWFHRYLQRNVGIVQYVRSQSLPSSFSPIHFSICHSSNLRYLSSFCKALLPFVGLCLSLTSLQSFLLLAAGYQFLYLKKIYGLRPNNILSSTCSLFHRLSSSETSSHYLPRHKR